MMKINELIESGELELYVYGALPVERNIEITARLKKHPELVKEVEEIEEALIKLANGLAPTDSSVLYDSIVAKIKPASNKTSNGNLTRYLGWAAALAFFMGMGYFWNQSNDFNEQLTQTEQDNQFLETELETLNIENREVLVVLDILKNPKTIKVPLAGQKGFEDTFAVAYYNPETNKTYIDTSGLPEAPQNMVYQVWSLKLDPLTPTSLSLIDENSLVYNNQLYGMDNSNKTEAFGITLEPAGGSLSPNLEKLYTLGVIK